MYVAFVDATTWCQGMVTTYEQSLMWTGMTSAQVWGWGYGGSDLEGYVVLGATRKIKWMGADDDDNGFACWMNGFIYTR